jgi:hypothetical protein
MTVLTTRDFEILDKVHVSEGALVTASLKRFLAEMPPVPLEDEQKADWVIDDLLLAHPTYHKAAFMLLFSELFLQDMRAECGVLLSLQQEMERSKEPMLNQVANKIIQ